MEFETIKQKVNDIIYEILQDKIKYEDIRPEKHLIKDYHIESIKVLEIFLTIMDEFDIEMDRKTIIQLQNINEIYLSVERLLDEKELKNKKKFKFF